MQRRVSLFGATGTIGDNTLDLVDRHADRFKIAVLTAHENTQKLAALVEKYQPECVVIGTQAGSDALLAAVPDHKGAVLTGAAGLVEAAKTRVDVTVMAIVGFAGLAPALTRAAQGGLLALANKEALVAAGTLLMQIAQQNGTTILPVDSEHNAIYQLLGAQAGAAIDKMVLTASGGPFREWSSDAMANATPAQAVAHPNWTMGAKISVDSATLMNKGLELIEAHYLFDIAPTKLDVLVHKQSIVHGLVYFNDGSVLAQKGSPDMRIPLAYCMAYPERIETGVAPLDLAGVGQLDFEAADRARFPCLALAEAAMRAGGAAPIVLNAANEVAVAAFLAEKLPFGGIAPLVAATMDAAEMGPADDLEAIFAADEQARLVAQKRLTEAG